MDTTLFYFFSTLAQVIAAIVALTGVFAIFKIQLLKEEIEGQGQVFYDSYKIQLTSFLRDAYDMSPQVAEQKAERYPHTSMLREAKISRDFDSMIINMNKCIEDLETVNIGTKGGMRFLRPHSLRLPLVRKRIILLNTQRNSIIRMTTTYVIFSLGIIFYSMMAISFKSIIMESCTLRIIVYLAAFVFIVVNFYLLTKPIKKSL